MKMRVVAYREGLNLRNAPVLSRDNIISQLSFLQMVDALEAPDKNGFVPCTAVTDGQILNGFVSSKFLCPLMNPSRESLLDAVFVQHDRFKRGLGQEHVSPFSGYVGEMWRAIGINLDGTDRDQPWSAAAVSFMVRNSGPEYQYFRFAAAHSKFTYDAINARWSNDTKSPFWGYELYERRPQPGDIVVRDNPEYPPSVDFSVAKQNDSYRSHSDIIVYIDSSAQKAIAIGGNVNNSVAISEYDLAPGNYLKSSRNTFALLANRTDEIALK